MKFVDIEIEGRNPEQTRADLERVIQQLSGDTAGEIEVDVVERRSRGAIQGVMVAVMALPTVLSVASDLAGIVQAVLDLGDRQGKPGLEVVLTMQDGSELVYPLSEDAKGFELALGDRRTGHLLKGLRIRQMDAAEA